MRRWHPRLWGILGAFAFVLLAGAGVRGAAHQVKIFHTEATSLQQQWQADEASGVPAAMLAPLEATLQQWIHRRVGPVPADWLGTGSHEIVVLQAKTATVVKSYRAALVTKAQSAASHLIAVEKPWTELTPSAAAHAIEGAQTPAELQHLLGSWNAQAESWAANERRLGQEAEGLTNGRPHEVLEKEQALQAKLAAAPTYWDGISGAQAALASTRRFLALPPADEVSRYSRVVKTLDQALAGLKAPSLNPFGSAFRQYLAGRQTEVSVAVYNANTGVTYTYNAGLSFDTASIVKASIMATLLWQSQHSGQPLTAQEQQLMVPMIEDSSNSAATTLWDLAGRSAGIRAFTQAAGMTSTVPATGGYWGLTQTTAVDQVQLLRLLSFPNHVLTPTSQTYAQNLMTHVINWEAWGATGGVPSNATVALKNGWLPIGTAGWEINSIGHVTGDGRNYVIAMLSRNNPTEAYGIQTLDTISQIVWQRFGLVP